MRMMCKAMQVSPSGYYAWRVRPESRRRRYDRQLTQAIRLLHAESDGTYGSPRLHAELNDSGFPCGRAKVARLMASAGLKGCPKRRFRVTTKRGMAKAENLLEQDFTASTINERWASDITYLWTNQGWLYLAVVMDLYSRRIIGWSMSHRLSRHLAVNALTMALDQRRPGDELIHHSDRGVQYMSDDFQELLKDERHHLQHERQRKLLRQRGGRELLCLTQKRTNQEEKIPHERRGKSRCVRLHRALLQPKTPTWLCRQYQSCPLRKPDIRT